MAEVWPNPANNKVNVQLHNTNVGKIKITLININGAEIKTWNDAMAFNQFIQLDLLSIPNGAYFIIISDEKGKRQTEKLLVQH
jgi:hypothetical protein